MENFDSCLMLGVYNPMFYDMQQAINPEHLHEYGMEDYPHITLLYGIHRSVSDDLVFDFAKNIKKFDIYSNAINLFNNEDFDVVKFEIDLSKELANYRRRAEALFLNHQTFPKYEPHSTLAYVLPKTGSKYAMQLNTPQKFELVNVKFSKFDKSGFTILV